MSKLSGICDYFVIASGSSTRQVKAITDHLTRELKRRGQKSRHVEGYHYALWVLLDCGAVIAHIFHAPVRDFYNLERLWGDAPQIKL